VIRTLHTWTDDEDDLTHPDNDLCPDQLAARRKVKD
jgi:hypothetical protein